MKTITVLLSAVIILQVWTAEGHVRLTFPSARQYAIDFLDNGRTVGPCGFPTYDGAPRTIFMEGTSARVTWHLSYAHKVRKVADCKCNKKCMSVVHRLSFK
ncbi:unnamed protein product [Clavelina lepadiformis]|uniref:Uncharacterized protein n=1 Tax=Clavelina lepadiformis TaxID=159417 RepID=A0ABP0FUQ7_CLALP